MREDQGEGGRYRKAGERWRGERQGEEEEERYMYSVHVHVHALHTCTCTHRLTDGAFTLYMYNIH